MVQINRNEYVGSVQYIGVMATIIEAGLYDQLAWLGNGDIFVGVQLYLCPFWATNNFAKFDF